VLTSACHALVLRRAVSCHRCDSTGRHLRLYSWRIVSTASLIHCPTHRQWFLPHLSCWQDFLCRLWKSVWERWQLLSKLRQILWVVVTVILGINSLFKFFRFSQWDNSEVIILAANMVLQLQTSATPSDSAVSEDTDDVMHQFEPLHQQDDTGTVQSVWSSLVLLAGIILMPTVNMELFLSQLWYTLYAPQSAAISILSSVISVCLEHFESILLLSAERIHLTQKGAFSLCRTGRGMLLHFTQVVFFLQMLSLL